MLLGSDHAEPQRQPSFRVGAENFDEAGKVASPLLIKAGFGAGMYDVWDATIVSPTGERREILKSGGWRIDIGTGKLSSLEEKVEGQ